MSPNPVASAAAATSTGSHQDPLPTSYSQQAAQERSHTPAPLIAGIVVGCLVFVALVALLAYLVWWRHYRKRHSRITSAPLPPPASRDLQGQWDGDAGATTASERQQHPWDDESARTWSMQQIHHPRRNNSSVHRHSDQHDDCFGPPSTTSATSAAWTPMWKSELDGVETQAQPAPSELPCTEREVVVPHTQSSSGVSPMTAASTPATQANSDSGAPPPLPRSVSYSDPNAARRAEAVSLTSEPIELPAEPLPVLERRPPDG